ncbi:MAG: stage II sporulation protein M [Thermoproteota archaeon]
MDHKEASLPEVAEQAPPLILQTKWGLFPITILVLSLVFILSSTIPMERSLAEKIYSEYVSSVESINLENPFEIFLNNFSISVLMMIPLVGFGFSIFASYVNGMTISAISLVENLNPLLISLWLVSRPFGILEFLAYGLASAQSLSSMFAIARKRVRKELKSYVSTILIVACLLLAAAFIEVFSLRELAE